VAGETTFLERLDGWQQRVGPVGFVHAVARKFSDDRAGRLAALVAYYAFFSVFPLMMAFSAALGIVLKNNPDLRRRIQDRAAEQIPLIGDRLKQGTLTGSGLALGIGLGLAIWAGLGATNAVHNALNEVWNVPEIDRAKGLARRWRGFAMLLVIGLGLTGSTTLAGFAGQLDSLGLVGRLAFVVGAIVVNIAVVAVSFRVLCDHRVGWKVLAPGAAMAGLAQYLLQGAVGTLLINNKQLGSQATYGSFATVIALLTWFLALAVATITGAEINAVLAGRLWPRTMRPRKAPLTEADERALGRYPLAQARVPGQTITVEFPGPSAHE